MTEITKIVGNLVDNVEIIVKGNKVIFKFQVAVNNDYENKEGQKVSETEYYTCFANKIQDFVHKEMKKGRRVIVEGYLKLSKYIKGVTKELDSDNIGGKSFNEIKEMNIVDFKEFINSSVYISQTINVLRLDLLFAYPKKDEQAKETISSKKQESLDLLIRYNTRFPAFGEACREKIELQRAYEINLKKRDAILANYKELGVAVTPDIINKLNQGLNNTQTEKTHEQTEVEDIENREAACDFDKVVKCTIEEDLYINIETGEFIEVEETDDGLFMKEENRLLKVEIVGQNL